MAEFKKGDTVAVQLEDGTGRTGKVHKIALDGRLVVNIDTGGQATVRPENAVPRVIVTGASTATTIGLQPDPPAGIARASRGTSATVLPSPVAPETNKSGIVPD